MTSKLKITHITYGRPRVCPVCKRSIPTANHILQWHDDKAGKHCTGSGTKIEHVTVEPETEKAW